MCQTWRMRQQKGWPNNMSSISATPYSCLFWEGQRDAPHPIVTSQMLPSCLFMVVCRRLYQAGLQDVPHHSKKTVEPPQFNGFASKRNAFPHAMSFFFSSPFWFSCLHLDPQTFYVLTAEKMMMVRDDCLVECKIDDSDEEQINTPPPPPEFASKASTPKPPTPPAEQAPPTPTCSVSRDPKGINKHLKVDIFFPPLDLLIRGSHSKSFTAFLQFVACWGRGGAVFVSWK